MGRSTCRGGAGGGCGPCRGPRATALSPPDPQCQADPCHGDGAFSVIVGVARRLFGRQSGSRHSTFNQALPPPEYPSLGNQSRYTRLFLTTSLAGATNWSRAECRFMRKWATKSRMLTVEFDAAANIGASGVYRMSRRESQEELRNMCTRVNAAHLRKAEQLRHPEASVRVSFVLLRLFILPPGPAWPLSPSPRGNCPARLR